MIGAYECAQGWCEDVSSWDVRGLVLVAVGAFIVWAVGRCV
jgi:hypothetical protein